MTEFLGYKCKNCGAWIGNGHLCTGLPVDGIRYIPKEEEEEERFVPKEEDWKPIPNLYKNMWKDLRTQIQQYFDFLLTCNQDEYRTGKLDGLEDVQEFMTNLEKTNV